MSNDMRIVKFKMMVGDILEDLGKVTLTDSLGDLNDGWGIAWLAIIYDYDKLNDYGKVIMEQVCALDKDEFGDDEDEFDEDEDFSHIVESVEKCKDIEYRMKVAKAFLAKLSGKEDGRSLQYLFLAKLSGKEDGHSLQDYWRLKGLLLIFWSLMILAVDDTDKEEHLSLICDFAQMLKISDREMMDIVQIIQAIYHMEGNFIIQTRGIQSHFGKVIERYGVKAATGDLDEVPGSF